jgi:low affinity Fe/Cu permease
MVKFNEMFSRAASSTTKFAGSRWAFVGASASIVLWLGTGPIMHYSDSWQLYANTGTTLITYLMVFLIQHTQNREDRVLQLKLDAILRALPNIDPRLIRCEGLSEDELEALVLECRRVLEADRSSPAPSQPTP